MLDKVNSLFLQLGFFDSLLFIFARILDLLPFSARIVKYYFFAQELSQKKFLPSTKGKKITVSEDSIDRILLCPLPRPPEVIALRYAQGAVCMAAYNEKKVFVGCLWYVKGAYEEDEVRCLYKITAKNALWDFDVYVDPKYRLSPVFLKLWDETSSRLFKEGYRWSISRISAFNSNSISSHSRMGAKIVGWAVYICAGSFQLTITNLLPFIHISFNKASRPTLKLLPPRN